MSEHKGPWVLPNGNLVRRSSLAGNDIWREYAGITGAHIATHRELPVDAIPLVPQTEVDAVKAERDRWHKLLSAIGRELETDSGGWFYDDLPKMAAALKVELAETKASLELSDTALAEAKAAPSLPAVDSPEAKRYAADVIEATRGSYPQTPFTLRAEAVRTEGLQAEKAKRDKVIEDVAHTISGQGMAYPTTVAAALLDRFDITLKSVKS